MTLSALFFSFMGVCLKVLSHRLGTFELVFYRSLLVLLIISPLMIRKKISFKGHSTSLLLLRSFFGFLALLCFFYTFSKLKLIHAILLNQISPIFVIIFSFILFKEKLSLKIWSLAFLGFFGVAFLFVPEKSNLGVNPGSVSFLPYLSGFLGSFLAGLAYHLVRKMKHKEHPLTVVFYFAAYSIVGCLLLSMYWDFQYPYHVKESITILFMGIFAFLGQWFLTRSYHLSNSSTVSLYAYLNPLFSWTWGKLIFNENLHWLSLIGATMIISSGILLKMKSGR